MSALEGRVAIVTGASSGIGEATALALAEAGASVVVGARRLARIEALCERITDGGGQAIARRTDVTRFDELVRLAGAAMDGFGRIDILVSNAGVMPLSPITDLRVADWADMIDVNVKGVLHGVGAVLPAMLAQRSGHIVSIGSLAGRRPFPGGSVYSASKFAVRALSWGLQLELSHARGIRITDVQPGVVDTELFEHIPVDEVREGFAAAWAGKRTLAPRDVAGAVIYAVTAPPHVNVNEILVRPTAQST